MPPDDESSTPSVPVTDRVTDAVLQASRAIVAIVARSLAATSDDVTMAQFRALVVLRSSPETNLSHLAESLDITASSATRLCDRLVERDLVRRVVAPESRREVRLSLTGHGRDLMDEATSARRRDLRRVLAAMSEPDRAALVPSLDAFSSATSQTLGLSWPSDDATDGPAAP